MTTRHALALALLLAAAALAGVVLEALASYSRAARAVRRRSS